MNLYSNVVPAGRSTVTVHNGLDKVYELVESTIADEVDQELNWLMDPVRKMFSPYVVLTSSLKVTGTAPAAAHVVDDVVVVPVLVVAEVVVVESVVTKLELEPGPVPEPEIAISA